ncbi:MAG: DciA family protein [Burkholderiales bacterium]
MSSRALQDILHRDQAFGALQSQVQSLTALQQAWQAALPLSLRPHSRVIGVEGNRLLVETESNAMAAKLRQLTPSLSRAIAQVQPEISSLRLMVAPEASRGPVRVRPAQPLTAEALGHFAALAETLAPSPLKTAVERLLEARKP